jgi:hypothetical protein
MRLIFVSFLLSGTIWSSLEDLTDAFFSANDPIDRKCWWVVSLYGFGKGVIKAFEANEKSPQ